jgi:general secretion pathway protein G
MRLPFRKAANDGRTVFRRSAGFSFIELIITAAILALLATTAMPMIELTVQHVREQELRTSLRHIREAIDAYKKAADEGKIEKDELEFDSGYPKTLESLVNGVPDITDAEGKRKLYFLRRIPPDPMYEGTAETAPAQTWGKRSYASAAEAPQEGKDVFDVFSKSNRLGLNGAPYNAW